MRSEKRSFFRTLGRTQFSRLKATSNGSKYWFRKTKFDLFARDEFSELFNCSEPLIMKIGYTRVSTSDQTVDLQVDTLTSWLRKGLHRSH